MKRESVVFLVGILLVVLPYLGVPAQWKVIATVSVGTLLILIGYSLRRSAFLREIEDATGERSTDSFVERSGSAMKTPAAEMVDN